MYNRPVIGSLRGGKTYKVAPCVCRHMPQPAVAGRRLSKASRTRGCEPCPLLSPSLSRTTWTSRSDANERKQCNRASHVPDAVVGKAHMLQRARCRVRRQRAMAHCHIQAVKGAAAPHGDGLDCWNGTSRLCGGYLINRRFVRYLGLNQFASASGKRRRTRPSPAGS